MTWEEQHRCRYHPMCMIHTGDPPPRWLTEEDVAEVKRLLAEGVPVAQISRETRISNTTIDNIKLGRTYRNE